MNSINRKIQAIWQGIPSQDGAGVKLNRIFGNREAYRMDPFLLLDYFYSDNPDDFMAGFPWHPHRGIETVTYMLQGKIRHNDSMGNTGLIESGFVQWMTAGSGIIHQEMPEKDQGVIQGFQLWVNLPRTYKMMAPRYRDIHREEIPIIPLDNGGEVRLIAGSFQGKLGPVKDVVTDPQYMDVKLPAGESFEFNISGEDTAFAYLFDGQAQFEPNTEKWLKPNHLVLWDHGTSLLVQAGEEGARFIFATGKPLKEPIAWYGPMVMNTQQELEQAFREYQNGTFIQPH